MTIDELIQAFPECERIKREDIAECITKAMTEEKFYQEAANKIWEKAHELYPHYKGIYDGNNAEQNAYRSYFVYNYATGSLSRFDEWMKTFETEFIARHGYIHTFEEACQIAADEWTRMIFGNHIQNNGDRSENGCIAMMLGTLAKDKASSGIGDDTVEKFRKLCKEYYLGGCIYEDEEYGKMKIEPYSDYGPNAALGSLLEQAGVPHDRIGSITPWKTGININKRDNSVCVRGYQTARYL